MLSVTQLARACGLSRTTVLYYESLGLLPVTPRSNSNYRLYSDKHLNCLRLILQLPQCRCSAADIRTLLVTQTR